MNMESFSRLLRMLQLLRHEISLAVMDAEPYAGEREWGHVVWHAFLPYLKDGDVYVWADEMEFVLLPALVIAEREDDRYTMMLQHLVPIIKTMRLMEPGPIYGCGSCR